MENEENKSNEMSFEESLKELEAIVRRLEMGDVPFKAMILVKTCDKKLGEAKESIAHLVKENGDIIDFNVDE